MPEISPQSKVNGCPEASPPVLRKCIYGRADRRAAVNSLPCPISCFLRQQLIILATKAPANCKPLPSSS